MTTFKRTGEYTISCPNNHGGKTINRHNAKEPIGSPKKNSFTVSRTRHR